MGVVRFAIKATLASGVVYYTVQEGLWSKSEESVKLYGKIYNNVAPYVKHNIPKEVVHEFNQLPSTSNISSFVKTSWNKGVMTSMKFVSEIPTRVSDGVNSVSESVQKYINQQSPLKEE